MSNLPELLAELLSEADARDLVDRVGLDAKHIEFHGTAVNIWNSVLREARKTPRKLKAIVDEAIDRYHDYADKLTSASKEYCQTSLPIIRIASPSSPPRGLEATPTLPTSPGTEQPSTTPHQAVAVQQSTEPISIFFSYSHKDEKLETVASLPGADSKIARQEQGESTWDPLNASELAPNSANGLIPSLIAWAKSQPPGNVAIVSKTEGKVGGASRPAEASRSHLGLARPENRCWD